MKPSELADHIRKALATLEEHGVKLTPPTEEDGGLAADEDEEWAWVEPQVKEKEGKAMTKWCRCGYQVWLDSRWNGLEHVRLILNELGHEVTSCLACGESWARDYEWKE